VADATNAERQRRFRAHNGGDHSLCRVGHCPDAADPGLSDPEWGSGAAQLWRELAARVPAAQLSLLREACRIVDRLDRMDGILARKNDWLRVNTMEFGENVKVKITMDGVLAEARQQATVAHALIKELAQFAKDTSKPEPKTGGLSDLSARIAARRSPTAG
jgi:hypothetical protein